MITQQLQEIFDTVAAHLLKQGKKSAFGEGDHAICRCDKTLNLLLDLQEIHDREPVSQWPESLINVAEKYDLSSEKCQEQIREFNKKQQPEFVRLVDHALISRLYPTKF